MNDLPSTLSSPASPDKQPQQNPQGFSPMPALGSFDYFETIHRLSHRAAITLLTSCNVGYDSCQPHGTCNQRCVCDSEPQKGFWSGDDCKECDVGWAGQDCKVECKGGACNRCSGHGDCNEGVAGDGSCTCQQTVSGYWDGADCASCKSGYFGEKCDKSCPGAEFGNGCWGRGECRAKTSGELFCFCEAGYESALGCYDCDRSSYGTNCVNKCDGYNATLNLPCSGHGACFNGTSQNGTCSCNAGWGLWDCSLQCPGNGSAVCSGHGVCSDGVNGDATCKCDGLWSPPDCSACYVNMTDPNCGAACPSNLADVSCSGHGTCTTILGVPTCLCASGYNGSSCELTCPGFPPCSGNGECLYPIGGTPTCMCYQNPSQGYWDGPLCNVCDERYNNSANCDVPCPLWPAIGGRICNGKGTCFNGLCICDRMSLDRLEYCGSACETSSAPSIVDSNLNCLQCTCEYCTDFYSAGDCVTTTCPGITNTDPAFACGGHGRCFEGRTRAGTCHCYPGWSGEGCELECPWGYGGPCSGYAHGICAAKFVTNPVTLITSSEPYCKCRPGFAGTTCQIQCPIYGISVCSGHGVCNDTYLGDGTCSCDPGWTGQACDVPCACNIWNGKCNATKCFNNAAIDLCVACICVGNYTNLCERCKPGTQGRTCEGPCIHGNTTGKICSCDEYWSGPACDIPCPRDNVNNTICGNRGICMWGNTQSGICQCNKYWFGANCSSFCDPQLCRINNGLMNPQCNLQTGVCECQNTAEGHWSGETCEVCIPGYFGQNCELDCLCSNHGSCDKNSGECQCSQSTTAGFYSGTACDACTEGYIGSNCERKSVAYTRETVKTDMSVTLQHSHFLFGSIPTTEVLFVDELIDRTYAGGFPLAQLDSNMSTPGEMTVLHTSATSSFNQSVSYDGMNSTKVECYNEVAHVFVHEGNVLFLMHPQIQCNLSVRIIRQTRDKADLDFMNNPDVIWEMPTQLDSWPACVGCDAWGNRTSRIVDADSITGTTTLLVSNVDDPVLVFVMAEPVRSQVGAWEPSCIVVRVRIALALSVATRTNAAVGKYLNTTYEMHQITLRSPIGAESRGYIMVSGRLQSVGYFDTWEVLEFQFIDGLGLFPDDPTFASIRGKIQCWPQIADVKTGGFKCDQCTLVGGAFYSGKSILLGMNHPDTAFAVWIRPFDDVKSNKQFFARLRTKCELSYYDNTQNQLTGLSTGLQTKDFPQWVAFISSAAAASTTIISMALDPAVSQLHFSLENYPISSVMIKFTFAGGDLSILGTQNLGFIATTVIGGATKPQPEVFHALYADMHSRVVYGIHGAVSPLRIAAFLLYDTLAVTPSIADQRGGTKIVVNGTGFKQMYKSQSVIPLVKPKCRFSNQAPVDATDLSPTGMVCSTSTISEADIAASCGGQEVEVSLYGNSWFTGNGVALRRVRAAKIVGIVDPQRGPLEGVSRVSFSGTGFIDSPFAICSFSSNHSGTTPKETLTSKLVYVDRNNAWCAQPPARYPSPNYAFLNVSLDGQLFMETTPPFYTIVGPAENVSTPAVITVSASERTRLTIEAQVVDQLNHWVGALDSQSRTICLDINVTEPAVCDESLISWRIEGDGYPWGPCRNNYYILLNSTRCKAVPPNVGTVSWDDFVFIQPRSGTFNLLVTYLDSPDRWKSITSFVIQPGTPHALALSNRRGYGPSPIFYQNQPLQPSPEIMVFDSLGNKVDNPPSSLTVFAAAYFVFDNNGTIIKGSTTELKQSSSTNGLRFDNIFLPFLNGVNHFINFTSSTPELLFTVSPAIRTSLCKTTDGTVSQYKVPETSDCASCPPTGATCNGTEVIVVAPGYWRGPTDTTDIYKCPGGDKVCRGSLNSPNGSFCAVGYSGPLCSICEKGYGKSGSTTCQQCGDPGSSIAIIVVSAVFLIVGLTVWTISILRQAQVTDLSIILRTVVNHAQATGKLGEFSTQWSPFLKEAFAFQSSASGLSFSGLSSLSCVISDAGSDYQAVFIGYMALPSLTIVMTALVLLTVRVMKLKPVLTEKLRADVIEEVKNMPNARIGILLEKYPWYMVATTTVSIFMFTLYQTLITQATSVLICTSIDIAPGVTQQYLKVDMSIPCDASGGHKFKTAAYLAAVTYGVGIPAGFVFGYRVVLKSIGNKELVEMMFQFLIGGYKPQYWYWQAVIMVRKLVLVLAITFMVDNPQLQSYGGMWTMATALILQIWFEPNEQDIFNRVEALSLAVVTITLNLGLLYYWSNLPKFGNIVLTAFLILVTLGVFLVFFYFMYEPFRDFASSKVQQIKQMYADWKANMNKPVEENNLELKDARLKYQDSDDDVVDFDKYRGEGRDKKTVDGGANFGDVDDRLGDIGRVATTGDREFTPIVNRMNKHNVSGKERRTMPVLDDEYQMGGGFGIADL